MEDKNAFIEQEEEKNITWEGNHQKIISFINEKIQYWMKPPPTVTEIAKATGLSRKTIYEHLRECKTHPEYRQRKDMFNMLESEVLMKICSSAIGGNTQAARLYLELTGIIQPAGRAIQTIVGNTNVQINGMVLNQQVLQNLNAEQLKKIEEIIKPALQIKETATVSIDSIQEQEKSKQKVTDTARNG